MSWTDTPKMSAEDEFQTKMDALSPRDQAIAIAVLTLCGIQQGLIGSPEPDHYKDMLTHMLMGVKHAAESDVAKFLHAQLSKIYKEHGKRLTIETVLDILARFAAHAGEEAVKALTDAKRLIVLLPPGEREDAS